MCHGKFGEQQRPGGVIYKENVSFVNTAAESDLRSSVPSSI